MREIRPVGWALRQRVMRCEELGFGVFVDGGKLEVGEHQERAAPAYDLGVGGDAAVAEAFDEVIVPGAGAVDAVDDEEGIMGGGVGAVGEGGATPCSCCDEQEQEMECGLQHGCGSYRHGRCAIDGFR